MWVTDLLTFQFLVKVSLRNFEASLSEFKIALSLYNTAQEQIDM